MGQLRSKLPLKFRNSELDVKWQEKAPTMLCDAFKVYATISKPDCQTVAYDVAALRSKVNLNSEAILARPKRLIMANSQLCEYHFRTSPKCLYTPFYITFKL